VKVKLEGPVRFFFVCPTCRTMPLDITLWPSLDMFVEHCRKQREADVAHGNMLRGYPPPLAAIAHTEAVESVQHVCGTKVPLINLLLADNEVPPPYAFSAASG
jgi:hypothetical protein